MTKQELQKELKEKIKEGIKPSDIKRLKRSKSETALEKKLEEKEVFTEAPEENTEELKTKISQLEQQILELRLSKIKDFGEYYEKKTELENELTSKPILTEQKNKTSFLTADPTFSPDYLLLL
ncbi:7836_t:CDS:2 [Ambispora gerdemannii]|uniref:7836_t:CDS:1 n=1 Tax=Ambispora gerdemannii TaxID=144530 RepID=A0A9N9DW62_9GLOM|nr:7836_t:CDS:2 [Ambispora gerdemannii]